MAQNIFIIVYQALVTAPQSKVLFHILYRKDHLSYFWNIQTCKTANLLDRFDWMRSSLIHSWLKFGGVAGAAALSTPNVQTAGNRVCGGRPAN